MTDTGPLDAHIVERVGALLGTPFSTGARLRGSDRWIVVRGDVGDRSVVVKQVAHPEIRLRCENARAPRDRVRE